MDQNPSNLENSWRMDAHLHLNFFFGISLAFWPTPIFRMKLPVCFLAIIQMHKRIPRACGCRQVQNSIVRETAVVLDPVQLDK